MVWRIHDPVDTELNFRPELTFDQRAMLIEWAVKQKYGGEIRVRGTDPEYPGSTFWEVREDVRITLWPEKQRVWATHNRNPSADAARIIRHLGNTLATHPPSRH